MRRSYDRISECDEEILNEYAKGTDLIIEVGTFLGGTADTFLSAMDGRLVCVDTFRGLLADDHFRVTREAALLMVVDRLDRFGDRVTIIIGESTVVASTFRPESADRVFLDGAHDYESVVADIRAWLPVVKPDGLLVGHDFEVESLSFERSHLEEMSLLDHDPETGAHCGVARAIEESFWRVQRDPNNRSSVWAAKPQWVRE